MNRDSGFYWVNFEGDWIVAEYGLLYDWLNNQEYGWHIAGKAEGYCENEYVCAPIYSDACFSEINETRLLPPYEAD